MITTVIKWLQDLTADHRNPSAAQLGVMSDMANTMAPGYQARIGIYITDDLITQTSVRTWPDDATAQAWIKYVRENYDVISADVHQDILDPMEAPQYGTLIKRY